MKYLIALLTAATGIMHLLVGFNLIDWGGTSVNWLLVANGVGYLVLLVLFWTASGNGGMIRWILLAYTLITFIGYFVMNASFNFGLDNTIALIIKAIELLLIILLLLYRGTRTVAVGGPATSTSRSGPAVDPSYIGPAVGSTTAAAVASPSMVDRAAAQVDEMADDAADMMDDAADAVGDTYDATTDMVGDAVDAVADTVGDAYDATADAVSDTADAVGDAMGGAYDATVDMVDDAADAASDTADAVGDAMSGAYDATVDTVGDAADAVGDAMGDTYDASVDMAGDATDAVGDAMRGGAMAAGAMLDDVDVDTADLGSEPSVEDLRSELIEYLRSFGPSSEFNKDIEYIEGVGASYGQKLRAIDINTVMDLVVNGATRSGRKRLSDLSGIAQSLILTWVNHVDLFRIKGVAQEYADLLEQSGVDTVMELAQRNPANLHKRMLEVNEQKALVRRAPHASEVQSWVEQAKGLRRLIHY